ncbi:MAG: hypothetical protein KC421_02655 [Anaerolineales bacterium]|nr:hypothetical protein [Anaerolineales bacterium]
MSIPNRLPGLNIATVLLAVFAAVWISLEGALWQVLVMGIGTTMIIAGYLAQRFWGGRTLSAKEWLGITAVLGLLVGIISVGMVLAFMAVKTGLHAHGPEFTPTQINWVLQQLPLWGATGLLAGTAVGLLSIGFSNNN